MCEILVRVIDKVNPNTIYEDVKCTKRGDVIVVQPDGWQWGSEELTAPFWRIIKLPNVPVLTATSFLAPEVDVDPQHPSRTLQRRAIKLDLANAAIPQAAKAWLADNTRAQPTFTVNFTPAQFTALKIVKAPVPDPNVL